MNEKNPFREINDNLKSQQKEFRLQCAVVEQLPKWYPSLRFIHIPNRGGSATDGYFKKKMGSKPGASDLLFTWAGKNGLQGGLIELKTNDGKLSPDQNRFLSSWSCIGWHTAVERTCRGVFERLRRWGLEPASTAIMEPDYSSKTEKYAQAFDFYQS